MNDNTLTPEKMQAAIDLVYPVLYYGTDRLLDRGRIYHVKKTDDNPEFIVFHPEDMQEVKDLIGWKRRMVHLKNEPFDESLARLAAKVLKSARPPVLIDATMA